MRMLKSIHGVGVVVSNEEFRLYNKLKSGTNSQEMDPYDINILDHMHSKGVVERSGKNYYIDGGANAS